MKKTKWKKWHVITIAALAVLFIIGVITSKNEEKAAVVEATAAHKPWAQKTTEEKREWLKELCKTGNFVNEEILIDAEVKKHFKYPRTVDYDMLASPSFRNGVVALADSGMVIINGSGTAKNAFNVPVGFTYRAEALLTESMALIKKVDVFIEE